MDSLTLRFWRDTGKQGDIISATLTSNDTEKDGQVNNTVHGNKLG